MRATDYLPVTNAQAAVQTAFAAISAIQHLPANEQLAGIAYLFNITAKRAGMTVSELVDVAERMERDADTYFQRETKALRDYVDNELRR